MENSVAVILPSLFLLMMLVVFPVAIKYLWSYLVPKLFPGAVEQNLITREISWKTSIILVVIFLFMKG